MSNGASSEFVNRAFILSGMLLAAFLHKVTGLGWDLTEVLIFLGVMSLVTSKILYRDLYRKFATDSEAAQNTPLWLELFDLLAVVLFWSMIASACYFTFISPDTDF